MNDPLTDLDANWLRRFRRNLRRWFAGHARAMPWREDRDPYGVWVSEIMLQQTTVAAVRPYFERFLAAFPDVATLASADEAAVLRLWEGLGYYSRARNLHRAAGVIVRDFGGRVPDDVSLLQSLPGVGRYTAGAIASFAFDRRAPIVEANTLRLYARLLGYDDDPRSTAGQRLLWEFAERILPRRDVGDFNLALMDLGATVCRIEEPSCGACPVRSCCRAFADGTQSTIPRPKSRVAPTDVLAATVAVERDGRFLVRRYGEGERWSGLWDFPRCDVPDEDSATSTLADFVRSCCGIDIAFTGTVTELRHTITRYRVRLLCHCATTTGGRTRNARWVTPTELADLPMPTPARRFASELGG